MRATYEAGIGRQRFPSALVIEATVGQARFVCDLVRGLGFDHVWAGTDSATGFADLHELEPDLLILGVDVEPLDGLTLARTVRSAAQPSLKDLPIIFLTPHATEEQVAEVRAIRRSILMVKPPSRDSLRSHIGKVLRLGDRPAAPSAPVEPQP